MRDPLLVGGFERVGDLAGDVQGFLQSKARRRGFRGLGQFLRERLALDELQHEPANALALFEAMYGRDVRVVQRGDHSRLTLEARDPTRLGRERERQNLDRDIATELGVVSPVHLTHSAAAKQRQHLEGPDPPAHERGDHITRRGAGKCSCRTANEADEVIRPERLVQQRLDLQLQVRVAIAFPWRETPTVPGGGARGRRRRES